MKNKDNILTIILCISNLYSLPRGTIYDRDSYSDVDLLKSLLDTVGLHMAGNRINGRYLLVITITPES